MPELVPNPKTLEAQKQGVPKKNIRVG